MRALLAGALGAIALFLSAGCASVEPYDYGIYRENMPTSVVVLPPLEETFEANASYQYLSTITRPLAERGYYVFPPAMVASMLRENGLPTPFEMHQASPAKLQEVFGADAALYVTLESWGTRYAVLQSVTEVEVSATLVDLRSGLTLWEGDASRRAGSSDGGGGLLGMAIGAALNQIFSSARDNSLLLAGGLNEALFLNETSGLLPGPLYPVEEGL